MEVKCPFGTDMNIELIFMRNFSISMTLKKGMNFLSTKIQLQNFEYHFKGSQTFQSLSEKFMIQGGWVAVVSSCFKKMLQNFYLSISSKSRINLKVSHR